jgi:hypothetical protein
MDRFSSSVALVVGMLMVSPGPAAGQGSPPLPSPLSLADVIRIATERRDEIAAARARVRAGEARPAIVSALTEPMISPSLDHLPFMMNGADVSVTIEQQIPLSGIRSHRRASALAEVDRLRSEANRLEWTGQYEFLAQMEARLRSIIPLTLVLVVALLYFSLRGWPQTLLVLSSLPFAVAGSIWLLAFMHYNLSTAVWVGLIAVAGVAAETGIVMVVYRDEAFERYWGEGRIHRPEDVDAAVVEGASARVRPLLMTVATTVLGLLPLLWEAGVGADVSARTAAPVVGGPVVVHVPDLAGAAGRLCDVAAASGSSPAGGAVAAGRHGQFGTCRMIRVKHGRTLMLERSHDTWAIRSIALK